MDHNKLVIVHNNLVVPGVGLKEHAFMHTHRPANAHTVTQTHVYYYRSSLLLSDEPRVDPVCVDV